MDKAHFARLFERDIQKLRLEIEKYTTEDSLWLVLPGTINSGGNLCQHLIGNLRTYIGLALGGFPYLRDRDAEFEQRIFTKVQLLEELEVLNEIVQASIEKLSDQELGEEFPRDVLDMFPEQNVSLILTHLLAHLSYHTGQVNYHRRWVTDL